MYIMISIHQGNLVLQFHLDLLVTFDTVDNNAPLHKFKDIFDVASKVLEWIQSYWGHHF